MALRSRFCFILVKYHSGAGEPKIQTEWAKNLIAAKSEFFDHVKFHNELVALKSRKLSLVIFQHQNHLKFIMKKWIAYFSSFKCDKKIDKLQIVSHFCACPLFLFSLRFPLIFFFSSHPKVFLITQFLFYWTFFLSLTSSDACSFLSYFPFHSIRKDNLKRKWR